MCGFREISSKFLKISNISKYQEPANAKIRKEGDSEETGHRELDGTATEGPLRVPSELQEHICTCVCSVA